MARSVHTDPIDRRAARRLAAADAPRGAGDRRRLHRAARRRKWRGATIEETRQAPTRAAPRLRIVRHEPGDGYLHPAGAADIRQFLAALPPRYRYKLRSIELRPAPPRPPHGALPLGRLVLPRRAILYAQPRAPWTLGGLLSDDERARLARAGARVSVDRRSCLTAVTWPGHSLRDFMLRDVLLHELTHHALQVRRAKLVVAAARRRDHEAVADGPGRGPAFRLAGGAEARADLSRWSDAERTTPAFRRANLMRERA